MRGRTRGNWGLQYPEESATVPTMTTQTEPRPAEPGCETPAEAIRRLLDADDRNVAWLAKKTGLSLSHLFRVTTGERAVSSGLAEKLAQLFGVPASTFRGGEERRLSSQSGGAHRP